ncbi:MAG TPA: transglycosylase family protein [Solirubrobacteraceae bacterium]|nr:transglycosylase family protein [Solirubrobacteraceae bacterium]
MQSRTVLRGLAVLATAVPAAPAAAAPRLVEAELAGHPTVRAHMRDAARDLARERAQRRLVARVVRLERDVNDRRLRPRALRRASISDLRDRIERLRDRAAARRERAQRVAVPPVLQAIAACESGGNPGAIGGGGAYRGKYQFDYATWASVGGSGDPAAAPEAEQDRRAAILYARAGAAPWPVCGG